MNSWKNHKLSFLFASGSMFLLLLFQVFWLKNIYQNEKDDLREKADLVFEDAVRSIEDSLFLKIILDTSIIPSTKESQARRYKVLDQPDNQIFNSIFSTSKEMKVLDKNMSIDLNLDIRSNFRQESEEKSFGSIAMWMASDTSLSQIDNSVLKPNSKQKLLEKKLAKLISLSDFPSPYDLVILKNGKHPKDGFFSSSHLDILSQNRYAISFDNYKGYILNKILPQLFFSIFLFSVILLSFFIMWQNLEKQRRLTELKNDFISNITHELKTPITTVGVALEALSNFNALQNPDRTEEYINISKHELQRLSILVDKVLKMSLFEKKEPELKLETFDMNELVENVLRSMKLQFEKFSASINFQSESTILFIKGDKIHLTNVVYNLIDNALKYSKNKPVIELSLKKKNNQLKLVVKDRGIGIAPHSKTKIFNKFYRVPQGDLHDVKGYGLGLSYVAGVIRKHHGDIQVDSQINEGTSFTISLPINYE